MLYYAIFFKTRGGVLKVLVLSDSHSALGLMQRYIEFVKPDVVIHLGDYVRDADMLAEEYRSIRFYQVAGNCDRYRVHPDYPEILLETIDGTRIFMTHGHLHHVKQYLGKLISDAEHSRADVALFGHTHQEFCQKTETGMWLMNPGSCSYDGGTCGVIDTTDRSCRILYRCVLEG